MFIFEKPELLYLLLLILPFTALFLFNLRRKRKKLAQLGDADMLEKQVPEYSLGKQHLKFFLLISVYALLVLAVANPQLGTSMKKVERKGIDVMIALDVSNSMNCNDIQPSRLMRAKQSVLRIIDKMESDRIGLVIFAGDAYLQLPLTTDYGAAKLFINNVQTSDLSRQGTAIGKAIKLCSENFDPKYEKNKNKAIIIISDGENHEDNAVGAAAEASKKGIVVSTVGMGSTQGAPIPEYRNGQIVSYKKDRNGQVVITHLNREMMQHIAKAGNGFYVEADNISSGVETVFEKLSKLDKVSFESQSISDYETRYQYFVAAALLLLILEVFLLEKRNKHINRANLFGKKSKSAKSRSVLTACLLLCLFAGGVQAQKAIPTRKGNRLYADSSFHDAEISYLRALSNDSLYYKARYNLGNAQYRQDNYGQALENYEKALHEPNLSKDEKADIYHNMGNAYMKSGDYQNAVNAYIDALKNKPGRTDSRYNLAYAQKMLRQQQQQQNQQQNQDKQQQQNQDKQQQQNQDKQQQQNQDKQQQQNQDKQQQQNQDKQQQQDQQNQNRLQQQQQQQKKQDAERMLRALENQEKNTLEKIKKNQEQNGGSHVEKDW